MLDMYEMENKIVEHLRSVFYLLQKENSIVINTLAVEVLFIYMWLGYNFLLKEMLFNSSSRNTNLTRETYRPWMNLASNTNLHSTT